MAKSKMLERLELHLRYFVTTETVDSIYREPKNKHTNMIAQRLDHRFFSLYQIRIGGCKGTVALDPRLKGKQLLIRDSMAKFPSDHYDLEICKGADVCRLYLNHQAIMLLEQLGVPRTVFLDLQELALFDLLDMMLYEEKAAKIIDHRTKSIIKLAPGMSIIGDPLMHKVLLLVLYKTIDSIKTNGRIELPLEYARNLMGTMDMTNSLEYGEVFIQYSTDLQKKGEVVQVLEGDVIITKFPAVHIGDMRRLEAVDVPALYHMVDCIVFPAKGHRPHADEMAGSDLDGDEFFVTWLPEFVDYFEQTEKPMNYTCKKKTMHRPVELNDVFEYITDYICNDNVGVISNALKVCADSEEEGFRSRKCRKLASKFSKAVDYNKTQISVQLAKHEKPRAYPDFMSKQGINSVYNSRRVLGEMYRVCYELSYIIEYAFHINSCNGEIMEMPKMNISKELLSQTDAAYNLYSNGLNEIMNSYGIRTEEEMIAGQILSVHNRLGEKKEMYSTVTIVQTMMKQYLSHFRGLFFHELGYKEEPTKFIMTDKMKVKAIAWYNRVYMAPETERTFLSFAWIVGDIIADIDGKSTNEERTSTDRFAESLFAMYYRTESKLSPKRPLKTHHLCLTIGEKFPALIVVWLFLYFWCRKEGMDFEFVRYLMNKFIEKNHRIHVPSLQLMPGTDFKLMMSYVNSKHMNSATINGHSVGGIVLAFLRHHASQKFLNASKRLGSVTDTRSTQLHAMSLKAYFHIAVWNDCDALVSSKMGHYISDEANQTTITVVIPTNIWSSIQDQNHIVNANIKAVFPNIKHVGCDRSNPPGRFCKGELVAYGTRDATMKLERVLNVWLQSFEHQFDYTQIFRELLGKL